MLEAGVLTESSRTELIEGEILEMSPMGVLHAAAVERLNETLIHLFRSKASVRPQLPLRLNAFNEPQPDLALLAPGRDRSKHPGPADTFLVMEISSTSLRYDRDVKLPIYAAVGVREVWIADLTARELLVYREPEGRRYRSLRVCKPEESISCLAFPDIAIDVAEILGSRV
jgi:Uma2 family endonuclease